MGVPKCHSFQFNGRDYIPPPIGLNLLKGSVNVSSKGTASIASGSLCGTMTVAGSSCKLWSWYLCISLQAKIFTVLFWCSWC